MVNKIKGFIFIFIWLVTLAKSTIGYPSLKKKLNAEISSYQKPVHEDQDVRVMLLVDIILAIADGPTVVFISDIESAIKETTEMAQDLELDFVIYNDPKVEIKSDELKIETNDNLFYIYLLRDYKTLTPLSLVSQIRKHDFTSNILFIMEQEMESDKFVNVFKNKSYHEVYFAVTSKFVNVEILEICLYCDKGVNSIQKMNEWSIQYGFKDSLIFYKSFKGNFHGADLVASTNFGFGIDPIAGGGYVGHEYFMLDLGSNSLNYKIRFNNPTRRNWGWGTLRNGVWTGLVGMVLYKKADIGIGSVSITVPRFAVVNPTYLQEYETIILLSSKPKRAPVWQRVFEAFTPGAWACTVVSLFIVGISFYLSYRLDTQRDSISMFYALGVAFKILCQEDISHKYPSAGAILILGFWMLSSTLIVSFYIGAMQSIILMPGFTTKPIDTFEDLADSNQILKVRPGTPYTADIKSKRHLKENVEFTYNIQLDHIPQGYVLLQNRNGLTPTAILELLEPIKKNPYHFGKEPVGLKINTWIVRKDCPFQKDIAILMMKSYEFGFYQAYKKKMALLSRERVLKYGDMMTDTDAPLVEINLPYFMALCRVILFGYVIAVAVFIGENALRLRRKIVGFIAEKASRLRIKKKPSKLPVRY